MGIILFFLLIIVVVAVAVIITQVKQSKKNKAAGVISTFGKLRLTPTELIVGWKDDAPHYPIAGLHAEVEDSGTVNRRMTATRMAAFGLFAAAIPKKLDDREVYVMVEGPSVAVMEKLKVKNSPTAGQTAREFALKLNHVVSAGSPEAQQD